MFSPSIDRGETVAPATRMTTPRIGGINDGVAWTGGSNLDEEKNDVPTDVLCLDQITTRRCRSNTNALRKAYLSSIDSN